MLTGSAPINPKVLELFGKIMGVPFIEGYGQTENTGGAFTQNFNDTQYGRVGRPWVYILKCRQIINLSLQIFRKWAIPLTTKTIWAGQLPEVRYG